MPIGGSRVLFYMHFFAFLEASRTRWHGTCRDQRVGTCCWHHPAFRTQTNAFWFEPSWAVRGHFACLVFEVTGWVFFRAKKRRFLRQHQKSASCVLLGTCWSQLLHIWSQFWGEWQLQLRVFLFAQLRAVFFKRVTLWFGAIWSWPPGNPNPCPRILKHWAPKRCRK